VPPRLLGVPLALFLFGKSDRAKQSAVFLQALPLLQAVLGLLYDAFEDYQTERFIEGDSTFTKPAERELALAFRAHDAELVKSLILRAGDLNAAHRGGDSLFRFCTTNFDSSPASFEIVKAMLAAGANPRIEVAGGGWALYWGIRREPKMTELLLNAGADPNSLDSVRPVWWEALESAFSEENLRTLAILLDHGADVTLRSGENAPLGLAADRRNWQSVWLLVQRGAAWKDERALGRPIPELLALDLEERRSAGRSPIPDELPKLLAMYEARAEGR
jgi:hypothetical protein